MSKEYEQIKHIYLSGYISEVGLLQLVRNEALTYDEANALIREKRGESNG